MLNSRDIDRLRPDVAANCRKFIELCKAAGYPVLVTGTVRDNEFQEQCYAKGTSKSKVPSFHSVAAGLAFDVCKNVKGQEYSDNAFWDGIGAIGKKMGFDWGGDWASFVDKPHFQWSQGGKYSNAMIRAGKYPPAMLLYEEEDEVTQEQFNAMMNTYLEQLGTQEPSEWSAEAREWAEQNGVITGDESGNKKYKTPCTREQMVQFLHRVNG